MISLRSSLEKLSAGARVIFGVAALLENTPFELYTLIRGGSARNASATMSRRTIWRSAEICRDIGFAGLAAGGSRMRTIGSAL
jgi:hypothetical protein